MSNLKGVPVRHLGVFTVTTLPASAEVGDTAYASDALKASQTTGNGTGNMVFFDGTNWIRVDTGVTATA